MSTATTPAVATEYTIRRKVFALFGAAFHIYNPDGSLYGYSKQKAFKLKEDIRVYADETMQQERLRISARQIIDFSAAYDVVSSATNQKIGAFQRKGWSSLIQDKWLALNSQDQQFGTIEEDGAMLAILRRFGGLSFFLPQTFHMRDAQQQEFARFRTHFNPFVHRMTVSTFANCPVDPQLVLAAGILLVAIEGRQKG